MLSIATLVHVKFRHTKYKVNNECYTINSRDDNYIIRLFWRNLREKVGGLMWVSSSFRKLNNKRHMRKAISFFAAKKSKRASFIHHNDIFPADAESV